MKGGQTTTQQQQQTNSYGTVTPPNTPDTDAFRAWKPQEDPGISAQFGRARNDLKDSYNNPLGSYTTPFVKEQALRSGMGDLNQLEGVAHRAGQYDVNSQELAHLGSVAELTSPRVVQTGSSGNSTSTAPGPNIWSSVIGAGAQVGSAFI